MGFLSHRTVHQHALQECLTTLWPELLKRYGEPPGQYTRLQLKAAMADLKTDEHMLPHLYATFLSENEYRAAPIELPAVDWAQIEKTAQAAYDAVQHTQPPRDNFHESWKGVYGG